MPQSPAIDDMAPQSISFIGDQDSVDLSAVHSMKIQQLFSPTPNSATNGRAPQQHNHHEGSQAQLEASLGKLNISSGSRTYRIPSPTRPLMTSKSFQVSVPSTTDRCIVCTQALSLPPLGPECGRRSERRQRVLHLIRQ